MKLKEKRNAIYFSVYDYTVEVIITADIIASRKERAFLYGAYQDKDTTTMALHSYSDYEHQCTLFFKSDASIPCIVHECIHAIDQMFVFIGVITVDTEFRAYHVDYLVSKVCKMLNKK